MRQISFKDISYLESSGGHFVQQSRTFCANFGRGHYEENFCEITLNLGQWFRRCFYIFLIYRSGSPFLPRSKTICAIYYRGHFEKHFCEVIWNVVQEMSFKDIYYIQLWQQLYSVEWNHFCNLSIGHYEEHSYGIILNLV